MSVAGYRDQFLRCADCCRSFTIDADELRWFHERSLSAPRRCRDCRRFRRQEAQECKEATR